jgi:hypothetical protein
MKTIRLFLLLFLTALPVSINAFVNSNPVQGDRDFATFLAHFTSSAAFQYSRIKFPLKTPITIMSDDGKSEKAFPFTKEKWPLLNSDMLKAKQTSPEGGGVYVSKFTIDTPTHKEFQAGYQESEFDLHVVFDLIQGSWYVTDCFTAYYSYDLSVAELKEAIRDVQKENTTFTKVHP